ncbi:retrovirus-related pol polyprotein from transposon TNT 1-94 [Tanacetum coccineum]
MEPGSSGNHNHGNVASTSEDGNALCCEAAIANESRKRFADVWLFDTGATFHMTARREWFHQYKTISEIVRHGGLEKTLVSLWKIDDLGLRVEIQNKYHEIIKGAHELMRGDKYISWHQKLGHMSEQGMKIFVERKLLPGLTKVSLPFCEHCVISKQHHLKFKISNSRSVYVLELVHSDVWQAPVLSLEEAKYFVSFIDDYSRRCWVQEGIKRQFTTAYTPQQNGVAERMNKTLLERARAMLATTSLGKSFWAEVVNTACYMINRSPSTAVELKTPMEMWTGNPVNYSNLYIFGSPVCVVLEEVLNNPDASFWKEAMQEEIEALHKNKTWELVERYRARLVVKGYVQKEGIDFNEIFSLMVRMTTIQVVLAMYATYDLHLEQLDVKTAFLHGNLEEEIYMLQPEGFKQKGKENLVCRLNKSLYGLKQASRCWYKFDSFIRSLEYNRLHADPYAYFKRFRNDNFILLLLYVDDMLIAGLNKDRINKLKAQLAREFEMKDLGPANKILRISEKFNVRDDLYKTRHCTCSGSRTSDVALCFGESDLNVKGYVDSDYAGDLEGSKSTTEFVFTLSSGIVSWVSKLQSVVALSTTEAEYVTAAQASKESVWLKILLEELGHEQEKFTLFCDNQSALYLARNPAFHSKTKHIRVQYYFVHEKVEDGTVDMQKIHTDDNVADYLTKAINYDKFIWCRSSCDLAET